MADTIAIFGSMLRRLGHLRVDRATGDPAPHKPLLLLVVLELAECGELGEVLELTPQLAFQFSSYFSIVARRRRTRPSIRLPFHHLGSDGVWTPLRADGQPSDNRAATRRARLSDDFLRLVRDPAGRDAARRLLIAKYFPVDERVALYALVGMPVPADEQIQADARQGDQREAEAIGRDARFRIEVVAAYDYTCALTGHRLMTIDAGSIVDAAHIHPFSDSRNNDPHNGLALCKNAHWTFDQGLWTIADDYHILVARNQFQEDSPDGRALITYADQPLRLPRNQSQWPDSKYLAWHRTRRFQGNRS